MRALEGIDLELFAEEKTVLLGPSGSGKPTLLNILGGLYHVTSDRVWFRDTELKGMGDRGFTRYRRHHVSFVFQFYNLAPRLTAREDVQLLTEVAPDPVPAEDGLALVGLGARMDHFPSEMSGRGGEQQRVVIARAIAKRPEILFCDELTGGLLRT